MTTLVLRNAGSMIGGALLGPIGAAVGGALGARAGFAIDQKLFGPEGRAVEGPRLSDLEVQTSTEGAPISKLYGRARLNGQIIWATNFVERVTRRQQRTGAAKGGTGGSKVTQTSYSYFANFAVGLCEGEIAYVGRIWANGTELDLQDISYRVYRGTEDQMPDSLIEAKQGAANAPAYRGLAYVVFEELPLDRFGNRIPQLTFEVVRSVGKLEQQVRSMVMIPGATEFGYDTIEVTRKDGEGQWASENRHGLEAGTDFEVSLDHLIALCPNLQRIALVVSWFGSDLRAGDCQVRPAVDNRSKQTEGAEWGVAGLTRANAPLVSQIDNRPAYGGTPSDATVKRAIAAIRDRGLEVVLYPFVMMDIPPNNGRSDPYGATEQSAFPWRGRITCFPGPEQAASADKTSAVDSQVAHFFSGQTWNYHRFITHYAQLATEAGGVDAFLIGSELRGLTQLRNAVGDYPFVSALKSLVADTRTIVGADCKLTYGADWSEYFGHQPSSEQGTVRFHLDPLWADSNIDAIGIDNYMPLSDWRAGESHLDAQLSSVGLNANYLKTNISAGEGYDWYYASDADRKDQIRTPITDGAAGKPWVYRYKDLANWWSNPHHERSEGIEEVASTDWVPMSKPIWFTEVGCPAVHLGANEPNRFPDPKSVESGLPRHSSGARDDAAQRALLQATLEHWAETVGVSNPVSPHYGGPMVDPDQIYLWAWDARPFPTFPLSQDAWSDGNSWHTGHWLNGRLGSAPLAGVITQVFEDYGLPMPQVNDVTSVVDGFVIDRPMSVRSALQDLCASFGLTLRSVGEEAHFVTTHMPHQTTVRFEDLVEEEEGALISNHSESWEAETESLSIGFKELLQDYRQSLARFEQPAARTRKETNLNLAVVSSQTVMNEIARTQLRQSNHERHAVQFSLPPSQVAMDVGDIIELEEPTGMRRYKVNEIEDGVTRRVQATQVAPRNTAPLPNQHRSKRLESRALMRPVLEVMDLPLLPGRDDYPHAPYIAAFAKPWAGPLALYEGSAGTGFAYRQILEVPAIMGTLISNLPSANPNVWDRGSAIEVKMLDGDLSSAGRLSVLSGQNAAAIKAQNGQWEIIQFQQAELVGDHTWRLTDLLRGQLGTEKACRSGALSNTRFVLLDEAVSLLQVSPNHLGKQSNFRLVPAGMALNDPHNSDQLISANGRGLKPLSPVHLRVSRKADNALIFHWIRRARQDADNWQASAVPLAEDSETYRLVLRGGGGKILRDITVSAPNWTYQAADQLSDGISANELLTIEINQISRVVGEGDELKRFLHLDSLALRSVA